MKSKPLGFWTTENERLIQTAISRITWWDRRRRGKYDSLLPVSRHILCCTSPKHWSLGYFMTLKYANKAFKREKEQSTEEWDYIPNLNALRRQQVAGNYSPSNVFHIGLVMFELMTLHYPDDPNIPRPYNFNLFGQHWRGWTYGHHLLEANNREIARNFSPELRHTVALCMEYNPNKRPGLDWLTRIVEFYSTSNFPNESDQVTRSWVMDFLGAPAMPRTPWDT